MHTIASICSPPLASFWFLPNFNQTLYSISIIKKFHYCYYGILDILVFAILNVGPIEYSFYYTITIGACLPYSYFNKFQKNITLQKNEKISHVALKISSAVISWASPRIHDYVFKVHTGLFLKGIDWRISISSSVLLCCTFFNIPKMMLKGGKVYMCSTHYCFIEIWRCVNCGCRWDRQSWNILYYLVW